MKRLNKKSVILAALGLLIGSGAYLNYQQAQRPAESQMSDLTLANLEAMAYLGDSDMDMDLDGGGVPPGTPGTNPDFVQCVITGYPSSDLYYACAEGTTKTKVLPCGEYVAKHPYPNTGAFDRYYHCYKRK